MKDFHKYSIVHYLHTDHSYQKGRISQTTSTYLTQQICNKGSTGQLNLCYRPPVLRTICPDGSHSIFLHREVSWLTALLTRRRNASLQASLSCNQSFFNFCFSCCEKASYTTASSCKEKMENHIQPVMHNNSKKILFIFVKWVDWQKYFGG